MTHPRIPGHRFLHSPGPTRIPDEVAHAMSRQPMDFGDPRVDRLIASVETGLKRVLQTERADVFLFASNGHGVWESTAANLVAPGQTVLVAGTGHFSESWAVQVEALGGRVIRTPWVEGRPIDPAVIEQVLRDDRDREIVALFAVHADTAASSVSDLSALRAALDAADHPALFVVDVVASLAAEPFAMDALGANVVLGASQKGLMTPPGLAFVAVDAAAFRVAEKNPMPRFYWDWRLRRNDTSYRKFCGTLPQTLMMGMEAALGLIFLEGLPQVVARHRRLAEAVHAAVGCWRAPGAVDFFVPEPAARSVSVTTVATAPGVDPEAIRRVAREHFQVAVAGGLGPLAGRAFRIGHLGDINPAMVLGCLAGVEAALRVQGVPIGRSGIEAAIAVLANGVAGVDARGVA